MKGRIGDRERLGHILDAIAEVESYIVGFDFELFQQDSKTHYATIKQLEIIGEAANNISETTKEIDLSIEWRKIIGLRHILVHEYFGIQVEVVWQIVMNDMPMMKRKTLAIYENL